MRVYKLDLDPDRLGFLRQDAPPTHEPGVGMTVAHDILEHFNDDKGRVTDELQAMGAGIFIRREDDRYFQMKGIPTMRERFDTIPGLAAIVDQCVFYDQLDELCGIQNPSRLHRPTKRFNEKAVESAKQAVRAMYLDQTVHLDTMDRWVPAAIQWMLRGYYRAKKRYHNNAEQACCMYVKIETEVNAALNYIRAYGITKAALEIRVEARKGHCWADLIIGFDRIECDTLG